MRSIAIRAGVLAALLALPLAAAAAAPGAAYLDDRSTPESLLRSLYQAVNAGEYARAWSYFSEGADRPDFARFAAGYADTASVELKLGTATSEGAAGSTYYAVPVVLRSVSKDGTAKVFTGCYALRLVQPALQAEPPFRPLGIVKGRLAPATDDFAAAMGTCPADAMGTCPADGL